MIDFESAKRRATLTAIADAAGNVLDNLAERVETRISDEKLFTKDDVAELLRDASEQIRAEARA